ncbi:S41 family peptidase [Halorussus amylolyticus]|uniref:S41 family peptidase n=1 Tax=Halorussus amylolyticus TaxID=1126242 RepID=UPI001047BA3B|nr:S41 family peptidase [Halorussus amylolyticus]
MTDETAAAESGATETRRETHSRAALAEDARALVEALERVHPDPYVGHGGRIKLHCRLEETIRNLPEETTTGDFYRRAAPLAAKVADGHTRLIAPDDNLAHDDRRLPISLRVVGTELYVDAVYDETRTDLLGSRLTHVEGRDVDALADRQAELRGVDNRYCALAFLCQSLEAPEMLRHLLDTQKSPSKPTVTFRTDEGTAETCTLTPIDSDASAVECLSTAVERPSGTGPRYRLLDGGRVALFVPGDLQGYREHCEVVASLGSEDTFDIVRDAHERTVGGETPDDLEAAISELPSMTETLTRLVREMDESRTETLLVDLRDNPGGNSVYADLLTYVLYGWDGIGRAKQAYEIPRRTDAHRRRYGDGKSLETRVDTAADNPADFDFGPYFAATDRNHDDRIATTREQLTQHVETFAKEATDGTHAGYYAPDRVVAVTSARTFSSGLAPALQLSRLGDDIVGVPSGQAPTLFGEPVREPLPNTGLELRVAGKYLCWHPDIEGDVLVPDCELTPERFESYGYAGDASLRLALDYVNDEEP